MTKKRKKRGPKPEYLQIDGDWEGAVKKVFGKKKPAEDGADDEKKEEKSG